MSSKLLWSKPAFAQLPVVVTMGGSCLDLGKTGSNVDSVVSTDGTNTACGS